MTTTLFADTNNHLYENIIFGLISINSNSIINVFDTSFFLFRISKFFCVFCVCFYRRFFCIYQKGRYFGRATTGIARVIKYTQCAKLDFIVEQSKLKKFNKNYDDNFE